MLKCNKRYRSAYIFCPQNEDSITILTRNYVTPKQLAKIAEHLSIMHLALNFKGNFLLGTRVHFEIENRTFWHKSRPLTDS